MHVLSQLTLYSAFLSAANQECDIIISASSIHSLSTLENFSTLDLSPPQTCSRYSIHISQSPLAPLFPHPPTFSFLIPNTPGQSQSSRSGTPSRPPQSPCKSVHRGRKARKSFRGSCKIGLLQASRGPACCGRPRRLGRSCPRPRSP